MSLDTIFNRLRHYWLETFLFLVVALAGFINLEHYPPAWWDEGWTLMVARNWVEQGHYGLYQDGLPRDAGLAGHFPMVALVALSFRVFGIGVWQGRLPAVLATLAGLALLYNFSYQWWGRRVALGTVFVCLFLCPPQLNILLAGRQTMGEVPAVCLLLAGYACLRIAFQRTRWWLAATAVFWGIGLGLKAQPLPFWLVSVFFYIAACVIRREWRRSGWVVLTAAGAVLVLRLLGAIPSMLTDPKQGSSQMIEGLMGVSALVLDINVRLNAVMVVVFNGLPTLLGLTWSGWQLLKELPSRDKLIHPAKWAIWGFASSWFAWFLFLGMAWPRYLFPAVLIASPFIAASFLDLTRGYDLRWLFRQSARLLTGREVRIGFQAFFCLLFIITALGINLRTVSNNLKKAGMINPQAAALRLQEFLPAHALVETYESEIMFLAPTIRFHYPPDQVDVSAIERSTKDPGSSLDYDPLQSNPDYLLVGDFGRYWGIYDAVLERGVFKLQSSFFGYDLYSRIH